MSVIDGLKQFTNELLKGKKFHSQAVNFAIYEVLTEHSVECPDTILSQGISMLLEEQPISGSIIDKGLDSYTFSLPSLCALLADKIFLWETAFMKLQEFCKFKKEKETYRLNLIAHKYNIVTESTEFLTLTNILIFCCRNEYSFDCVLNLSVPVQSYGESFVEERVLELTQLVKELSKEVKELRKEVEG